MTEYAHGSRGAAKQPRNQGYQRRLAAAARTDQHRQHSSGRREVDPFQHADRTGSRLERHFDVFANHAHH